MTSTLQTAIEAYNNHNYEKAYELFYPLATYQKDPEAQYFIGLLYSEGSGVEKDIEEALKWWKKAMRQRHPEAAYAYSEIQTSTKNMF